MTAQPENPGEQQAGILGAGDTRAWLKSFVESVAIFAAVFYGLFYYMISRFYGEFGLTPEDAGWDLPTTLARFAGVIAYAIGLVLLMRVLSRSAKPMRSLGIGLAAVVAFFVMMFILSSQWDDRVREGGSVSERNILFRIPTPCVTAQWTQPNEMARDLPALPFDGSERLTLLAAQETVTLFVPDTNQVVRAPASMVILASCAHS